MIKLLVQLSMTASYQKETKIIKIVKLSSVKQKVNETNYFESYANTHNLIRTMSYSEFVNLEDFNHWMLKNIQINRRLFIKYNNIFYIIHKSIKMISLFGIKIEVNRPTIYTSHEILTQNIDTKYYNGSSHFLWINENLTKLEGPTC